LKITYTQLRDRKHIIVYVLFITLVIILLHYFFAYTYYYRIVKGLNETVATSSTFDPNLEILCQKNDSINNAYRDLNFLRARLQLAKSDSAGLIVSMPDSMLTIQIKGVDVFKTKIVKIKQDNILHNPGIHMYQYLYGKPLKIKYEEGNVEKEPLVHVIAPADTSAAKLAPRHQPDTTLTKVLNINYLLENNIRLVVKGDENPSFSHWILNQIRTVASRIILVIDMISSIFSSVSPVYQPEISVVVNNRDALTIYRALQSHARICIKL